MRSLSVALLLAATACGEPQSATGGEDTGAPPPADPIPRGQAAPAMIEAVCAANEACGCEPGCEDYFDWTANDIVDTAVGLDLQYDPQCMGELVQRVEQAQCELSDELSEAECEASCRPFFGTLATGEACFTATVSDLHGFPIRIDECDADNVCIAQVCQPRCSTVTGLPEGEPCWFSECADGLVCDAITRTCTGGPAVGDACSESFLDCGDGWCETPDRICQPLGERGDGCNSFEQCDSGYCPNGTCQARPALGEPCYGPCQDGLRCSSAICVPYVCWR